MNKWDFYMSLPPKWKVFTQHGIYDGLGSEKMVVRTGDFISRCKLAKHHFLYIFTWQQKWFVFWWDYATANIPLQNGASWVLKISYPKISDINMSEENPHFSVTISRFFATSTARPEIMGALNKDTLRSLDAQCGRWSSWTVLKSWGSCCSSRCSIVDIGGCQNPWNPLFCSHQNSWVKMDVNHPLKMVFS